MARNKRLRSSRLGEISVPRGPPFRKDDLLSRRSPPMTGLPIAEWHEKHSSARIGRALDSKNSRDCAVACECPARAEIKRDATSSKRRQRCMGLVPNRQDLQGPALAIFVFDV